MDKTMTLNMNKALIAGRFSKAIGTYAREAGIQQQIAEKMAGLLKLHLASSAPTKVVEFGCGTGNYSRLLYQAFQPQLFLLNDLCKEMKTCCTDLLDKGATFLAGDAETLPFPKDTELLTSCSTLQWFDNPEGFFRRSSNRLSAKGCLAFTTFGPDNMNEIHAVTGKGLPYRSLHELQTALAPFYDIVHAEEERILRNFSTPMQVLLHLKETGVTGTGQHRWTRGELNSFCETYARQFGNGLSVHLTYHPIYIIAIKKEQ